MASTVFKPNNGGLVRFNRIPYLAAQAGKLAITIPSAIDAGLCIVRFRINNAIPGGVVLLNIGYFGSVITQQWHNMTSPTTSVRGNTDQGLVLTINSSTFTASQTVNVRIIQFYDQY